MRQATKSDWTVWIRIEFCFIACYCVLFLSDNASYSGVEATSVLSNYCTANHTIYVGVELEWWRHARHSVDKVYNCVSTRRLLPAARTVMRKDCTAAWGCRRCFSLVSLCAIADSSFRVRSWRIGNVTWTRNARGCYILYSRDPQLLERHRYG